MQVAIPAFTVVVQPQNDWQSAQFVVKYRYAGAKRARNQVCGRAAPHHLNANAVEALAFVCAYTIKKER